KIVFAEIYDFSILQFLIATSLIRLVGDAELVAFAHPENIDATRFLERTWNRFVGDEAIVDQVLPSFVVRAGRSGSLAAALRCVVDGFPRARLEALLDSDYLGAAPPRLARVLRRTGFVAEAARPLADCVAHRVAALAEEAGDARVPPERRRRAAERRARLAGDGARLVTLVETLRGLDGARTPAGHVRALGRVLRDLRLRPVPRGALLPATTRRDVRARERLEEALDQLAGLARALGMAPLALGDFLRLLLAALEPLQVEDAAARTGSVRALSLLHARG